MAGKDLTGDYRKHLKVRDARKLIGKRLAGKTVLLVPGFLSNAMRLSYFTDQLFFLRGLAGVDADIVDIDSEEPPEVNAREIRKAIRDVDPDEKIVLVTHSKGSLDVLHLLLDRPKLYKRVAAWISIQGALLGSPIADFVDDDPVLRDVAGAALRILGGSLASLRSLRTDASVAFVERHEADGSLAALLNGVKTVCYGSAVRGSKTLLLAPRDAMEKRKKPNDGLMPLDNTFLPGAPFVRIPNGPDHAAPVLRVGVPLRFDRNLMTAALMRLVL